MNTEETLKNKNNKKTPDISIWKHDIGFMNFLRAITFTILEKLQSIIILSTLRPRTM